MKKNKVHVFQLLLILSLSLFLGACGKDFGLSQVDISEVEKIMDGKKDGFLLVVKDNEEYYIPTIKQIADDEEVVIDMYNTYQPDGKKDINKKPNFKYASDLKGSRLYYIKGGEIQDKLKVSSYADMQLSEEVIHFVQQFKGK